jgi:hypothetical protein
MFPLFQRKRGFTRRTANSYRVTPGNDVARIRYPALGFATPLKLSPSLIWEVSEGRPVPFSGTANVVAEEESGENEALTVVPAAAMPVLKKTGLRPIERARAEIPP